MKRNPSGTAALFLLTALSGACAAAPGSRVASAAGQEAFTSRVVATGLDSPWEIAWGPDDYIWVTERAGKRVTRVSPLDGSKTIALGIPEAYQASGQDGVLGMALHPELLKEAGQDYVYLAFVYDADPGAGVARRAKIRGTVGSFVCGP